MPEGEGFGFSSLSGTKMSSFKMFSWSSSKGASKNIESKSKNEEERVSLDVFLGEFFSLGSFEDSSSPDKGIELNSKKQKQKARMFGFFEFQAITLS